MTHALAATNEYPKADNGLTLPLSRSLGLQDLAKHRAMVALELEVLSKKLDRFGWERDRNSPAQDRLILDWMDALQDYPLDEIRMACRAVLTERPNAMPHEGHVLSAIQKRRAELVKYYRPQIPEPPQERELPTPERRAEMAAYAADVLRGLREKAGRE